MAACSSPLFGATTLSSTQRTRAWAAGASTAVYWYAAPDHGGSAADTRDKSRARYGQGKRTSIIERRYRSKREHTGVQGALLCVTTHESDSPPKKIRVRKVDHRIELVKGILDRGA
eukprot:scaffold176162_cov30-Tisochrysis_lutea.AAC.4